MIISRAAVSASALFICIVGCTFHDSVNDDYFSTVDRVKGGNKPVTPAQPVVTACGNVLSVTMTAVPDPDGDQLFYNIYATPESVACFGLYDFYDPEWLIALVYDITDPVSLLANSAGIYTFWYTAYDGGRESDHSPVVTVTTPGSTCP